MYGKFGGSVLYLTKTDLLLSEMHKHTAESKCLPPPWFLDDNFTVFYFTVYVQNRFQFLFEGFLLKTLQHEY